MAWQDNNGGNRGPWGQGPRGPGGGGGGQQPPNLDDILKKGQDQFKSFLPRQIGGGKGLAIIAAILVMLWAGTGFFRVQPNEQGIVLVFGEWNEQLLGEGLHWNWPAPIGEYATPKVTEVRKTEVGFVTRESRRGSSVEDEVLAESLMLTGDENIIDIDFEVFWQIKNAGNYLFEIQYPEETVKAVAESVMREVVGITTLTDALTSGRSEIEVTALALMQEVLDSYNSGIQVRDVKLKKSDTPPEVIDEFRDVQAAGADQQALINQAQEYANKILPEARGQAAIIGQQAEAYKAEVVARSQGEASRFVSVYNEYRQAEDVTKKRMYLETMEQILGRVNKVIIDGDAGSGVVPYLPLPEVQKRSGGK